MAQLEKKYNWPTIYISFYFELSKSGLYSGYIEFADTTTRINDMTFGG